MVVSDVLQDHSGRFAGHKIMPFYISRLAFPDVAVNLNTDHVVKGSTL